MGKFGMGREEGDSASLRPGGSYTEMATTAGDSKAADSKAANRTGTPRDL